MALVTCNECGKKISSKATSCSDCGNPISKEKPQKRAGAKYEALGFLLIAASVIVGFSGNMNTATTLGTIGFIVFIIGRLK